MVPRFPPAAPRCDSAQPTSFHLALAQAPANANGVLRANPELRLHNALRDPLVGRAQFLGNVDAGIQELSAACPPEGQPLVSRYSASLRSFLATRPQQLVTPWLPAFCAQLEELGRGLLRADVDIIAARRSFLPQFARGAQLSLLGARLFNVVSSFDELQRHRNSTSALQCLQSVRHALEFWTEPKAPLTVRIPVWNTRSILIKIEEVLNSNSTALVPELHVRTIKRLIDLIKLDNQWLRWSVPHNLLPLGSPEHMEQIQFAFDRRPAQAAQAYGLLSMPLTLVAKTISDLFVEAGEIRTAWQKALHLLMPSKPPPFLVHFRETPAPESVLREIQIIQHLWRQEEVEKTGSVHFHEVEDPSWLRARLHASNASLFALIHEHNIHTFYLVLYDEQSFPPGPMNVITTVEGSEGLRASILQATTHSEYAFADLTATDPRDRKAGLGRGVRPYNLVHRAAEEFGELDADGTRPVKWYAICHATLAPNRSLTCLLRDGWQDTGLIWESSGGNKFAILKR